MLAEAQQIAAVGSWSWDLGDRTLRAGQIRCTGSSGATRALRAAGRRERLATGHSSRGPRARRPSLPADAVAAGDGFELDLRIRVGEHMGRCPPPARDRPSRGRGPLRRHRPGRERRRRRTQQALRAAQERLRVTVAHAPIGVALVELGGTCGPSAERQRRAVRAGRVPRGRAAARWACTSIVHSDDGDSLVARPASSCASDDQARIELEVRCVHRSGTPGAGPC